MDIAYDQKREVCNSVYRYIEILYKNYIRRCEYFDQRDFDQRYFGQRFVLSSEFCLKHPNSLREHCTHYALGDDIFRSFTYLNCQYCDNNQGHIHNFDYNRPFLLYRCICRQKQYLLRLLKYIYTRGLCLNYNSIRNNFHKIFFLMRYKQLKTT